MTKALTVGVISERLGQPLHVVEYLIRARKIQPILRAGNARVFSDEAVAQIGREVEAMRKYRTRDVVTA